MKRQPQAPSGALNPRAVARINEALDTLVPSGQDYSIETWTQRLESFLYKKIHFIDLPLPAGFFGARVVLLPAEGACESRPVEVVITSSRLIPLMREHVQAHELAHISLGHQTTILTAQQVVDLRGDILGVCCSPGSTCRAVDPHGIDPAVLERDIMAETLARLAEQRRIQLSARDRAQGRSSDAAVDQLIRSIAGE